MLFHLTCYLFTPHVEWLKIWIKQKMAGVDINW